MSERYSYLLSDTYSGGRSMRNEELNEEDVWGVHVKERQETKKSSDSSSVSSLRRVPTSSRMIPRANKVQEPKAHQHSAPINIPDWSKIYGKNENDDDEAGYGDAKVYDDGLNSDEDEDEWVPPHEWIAKKLARSQISSFSVCEGVGRTLKGRDLSKVRNAVLSRTGFLE